MQKECIIRICSTCDKPLPWSDKESGQVGWLCCDEYYCSEKCLYTSFYSDYQIGGVAWNEHYTEDGDCYHTHWELEVNDAPGA